MGGTWEAVAEGRTLIGNGSGYSAIEESKIVYLLLDEVKKLKAEVERLNHTVITLSK